MTLQGFSFDCLGHEEDEDENGGEDDDGDVSPGPVRQTRGTARFIF